MTSVGDDTLVNPSLLDAVKCYVIDFFSALTRILGLASNITLQDNTPTLFISDSYNSIINWVAFDEFQYKLLKGFLLIFFANILLIFVSWKIYGKRISERFMKRRSSTSSPSMCIRCTCKEDFITTSKAIEELRKSVSLLKLPKEHSPRI